MCTCRDSRRPAGSGCLEEFNDVHVGERHLFVFSDEVLSQVWRGEATGQDRAVCVVSTLFSLSLYLPSRSW